MESYPLPQNEADLMAVMGTIPYVKRNGYAIRLAQQHASDPRLLTLIHELLATSPLPSKVPYPVKLSPSDSDAAASNAIEGDTFIELRYPQTNASKRFVQRELGLTMALTVGESAVALLLDALLHPSNAGRKKVVAPCVKYATDDQLVDVYHRCVPAVQAEIRAKLTSRTEVKKRLGIPVYESKKKEAQEPAIVALEKELQAAKAQDRATVWEKHGYK
jgi:hypothetical protein